MDEPNNRNSPEPGTRRDFPKKPSTAVAGGALLGSLSVERGAHAAGSDTLRIALIGCGGRGSGAADQALNAGGNGVKLIAMADAFKDRLDGSFSELKKKHQDKVEISDDHKFVGFDEYKAAIAHTDVVVLAKPPRFRPIHFGAAVRQGNHIFMEIPV